MTRITPTSSNRSSFRRASRPAWHGTSREQFEAALANGEYDLILADYLLPSYNGIEALRHVKDTGSEIPFLLVSGTIGEQAAIESLKAGATDYVLNIGPTD